MASETTRQKIIARLKEITVHKDRPITDDTEIYYDLRIFGSDLYEFLVWISREFNVPVQVDPGDHSPQEGMPPLLFRKWRERREREKRPYKSLTVLDILGLVDRGRRST